MNNRYNRLFKSDTNENEFWPSFTDMLTTILLVILLFLMAFMLNEKIKTDADQKALAEQKHLIEEQQREINYLKGINKKYNRCANSGIL